VRCNVEFDHAFKIRFSPDSKSFITGLGIANTLRAFKIIKKDDSSVQMVPAAIQDFPIVINLLCKIRLKAKLTFIGSSLFGPFCF
jgi:hypothetical protein